ncbi:MAG: hypothetical protein ACR2PL_13820 [Dehalococcoidia bacterium]
MSRRKLRRRTATEDWQLLQAQFRRPEERSDELIRPSVRFGRSPAVRARETVAPPHGFGYRVAPDLFGGQGVMDAEQDSRRLICTTAACST